MCSDGATAEKGRERQWHAIADLLARYDRPGPRYTSYPTAVEFTDAVDVQVYEAKLAEADRRGGRPVSVYVHLPFCEQRCLFCGCNVIVSPDKARAVSYLDLVVNEARLVADALPHRRRLCQLHLGGGTPTYFSAGQLETFLARLFDVFPPTSDAELAVEIDPRVTSDTHVDALGAMGFNRISLGVQDFDPVVQKAIGRVQPLDATERLIERARRRGYAGINVDLIYGLPHQTPAAFAQTVDTVVHMGVDRAAVYSFAYVPWLHRHMKRIDADALPDQQTKLALFAAARDRFLATGYEAIGMDHFARPDDELAVARRERRLRRNFQGYCVQAAEDVVGLGISAIGDVADAYVQNTKKLSLYQRALSAGKLAVERGVVLSRDDQIRRHVIHALMCNFHVDMAEVETRFSIRFSDYFAEELTSISAHQAEGMVNVGGVVIDVTPLGQLFVRNLAMCFDRYLRRDAPADERPIFSRTV